VNGLERARERLERTGREHLELTYLELRYTRLAQGPAELREERLAVLRIDQSTVKDQVECPTSHSVIPPGTLLGTSSAIKLLEDDSIIWPHCKPLQSVSVNPMFRSTDR